MTDLITIAANASLPPTSAGIARPALPQTVTPTLASVCMVVPTRDEQGNVGPLVTQLSVAFASRGNWEILFVDDSDDSTPTLINEMTQAGLPVRLLHRPPGTRAGGLGTAVAQGFAATDADILLVLDADLQHPPAMARTLVDVATTTDADIILACRYCPGGAAAGLAGPTRRIVSAACRQLTRTVLRRVRHVRDPLGGFFALRRDVVGGVDLRPDGFKILLEILIKGHWASAVEVPYTFAPRAAGHSKAQVVEGMRFLRHLATLRFEIPSSPSAPVRIATVSEALSAPDVPAEA